MSHPASADPTSPRTRCAAPPSSLLVDRADVLADPTGYRILTGDRPTGPLHLGHYLGTLRERVQLQDAGVETFVVVADYQVITDRTDTRDVVANVREVVLDQLAAGLDPLRSSIFVHSEIAEIHQLMLPLLSATTLPELQRNPTVKAEAQDAGISAVSGLLLTYPVHQAADILAVGGTLVPAGDDQLPHVEQTRAVARRINERYGAGTLVPPQALLGTSPRLLGTDGRKMAKSRGNAIALRDDEDRTAMLLRAAVTDSERTITYDPVHRPQVAGLLELTAAMSGRTPQQVAEDVAGAGAARLKQMATEAVNETLRPLRRRRAELASDPRVVRDALDAGASRVQPVARATLDRVHAAMGLVHR
jgi:tryptophanyl-tRNA synthetase